MERKRVICLFLFVGFMLVFSSCHSRHLSDIKPAMTKEEVVSLWGRTDLISYKTTDGTTLETWEYHFATSGSICWITFIQDRVATTQCHRNQVGGWYYSQGEREPYPEPYYYPQFYNYSYYSPYYYPYYYPFFYPYPYSYGGYYRYYRPYPSPYRYPYYRYRR